MEAASELLVRYPWFAVLLRCAVAAAIGLAIHVVLDRVARRAARHYVLAETVVRYTRRPARLLVPLLLVHVVVADAPEALTGLVALRQALSIAVILLITTLVTRLISAFADVVAMRHPTSVADNLRARSVHTQVRVLARTAMFIVALLGVGSALMTFPNVRQVGASLLASAGLAGIVAGLAARPVLGNLIAGLQIALAQPIRIDDVLIVDNEWGRVEEITETYVVMRIWDDRRLIIPLEYLIQHPFQNWTRRTSDLIGSVFLWVDYRMPLPPLREALQRMVEAAPEWDRRVCVLQVVDVSEHAMQLRVLVSTRDAGLGWELRCKVREQLIFYLQAEFPDMLPRVRATLSRGDGERGAVAGHTSTAPSSAPSSADSGGAHAPITP